MKMVKFFKKNCQDTRLFLSFCQIGAPRNGRFDFFDRQSSEGESPRSAAKSDSEYAKILEEERKKILEEMAAEQQKKE